MCYPELVMAKLCSVVQLLCRVKMCLQGPLLFCIPFSMPYSIFSVMLSIMINYETPRPAAACGPSLLLKQCHFLHHLLANDDKICSRVKFANLWSDVSFFGDKISLLSNLFKGGGIYFRFGHGHRKNHDRSVRGH